ncbi:MAG: hypothetical protein ACJAT4_001073 [Granulosicoccus sp.]|jgi:hypothetical protein
MGNLFDGLFLYEIILMLLGSVLFGVVIFLMVKNKELNKNHLMGISLAIVMIAFPSIKSFSISDGIINIERDLEELKKNPNDKALEKNLEQDLGSIGDRPISNVERLTTLSEANLELGKKEKASTLAKEALAKAPKNLQAAEVINVIEVDKKIESLNSNPNDKKAKDELKAEIKKLKEIPTNSGRRTSQIAKGYEALGDKVMAKVYIDSTRMYQPKHPIIKKFDNKNPLIPAGDKVEKKEGTDGN